MNRYKAKTIKLKLLWNNLNC